MPRYYESDFHLELNEQLGVWSCIEMDSDIKIDIPIAMLGNIEGLARKRFDRILLLMNGAFDAGVKQGEAQAQQTMRKALGLKE